MIASATKPAILVFCKVCTIFPLACEQQLNTCCFTTHLVLQLTLQKLKKNQCTIIHLLSRLVLLEILHLNSLLGKLPTWDLSPSEENSTLSCHWQQRHQRPATFLALTCKLTGVDVMVILRPPISLHVTFHHCFYSHIHNRNKTVCIPYTAFRRTVSGMDH